MRNNLLDQNELTRPLGLMRPSPECNTTALTARPGQPDNRRNHSGRMARTVVRPTAHEVKPARGKGMRVSIEDIPEKDRHKFRQARLRCEKAIKDGHSLSLSRRVSGEYMTNQCRIGNAPIAEGLLFAQNPLRRIPQPDSLREGKDDTFRLVHADFRRWGSC